MSDKYKERAAQALKYLQEKGNHTMAVNLQSSPMVEMSPKECAQMCKRIGVQYHEGLEKRVIQYRFTDTTVDRHNEVIIPKGVELTEYRKDPLLLGQHGWMRFNIGKSLQTKFYPEFNDVAGMCMFFDDVIDRTGVSEDFFRYCQSGAMQQGSIGFLAKRENVRHPSPEECELYGIDKYGFIFDKIKLLEFSPVTIPANPNARQVPSRRKLYRNKSIFYFENTLHTPDDFIKEYKDEDVYIIREGIDLDEEKLDFVEDTTELETIELEQIIEIEKAEDVQDEKQEATKVQTLIFSKKVFKTAEDVHKWLKKHPPFKLTKPLDETETSWRARQRDPEDFDPKSFRTINITKGVQAVIGKLKKAIDNPDDGNMKDTPSTESENAVMAEIYIGSHDTPEQRQAKLEEAIAMNEKGIRAKLFHDKPEETTVINNAGLTNNMKTKIEDAITAIADLRTDLDSLLKSADDGAEGNSEDDLQGSLDADESLYAMGNYNLSKALRKIKKT